MRLVIAVLVVVSLMLGVSPSQSASQAEAADCRFVLGFKAVHDAIPEIVGDCTTNERYNPSNGDALQNTTRGLLVWRKADNFTAFTDGYRTWVNGPYGVQERLNTERFEWESDPVASPESVPSQRPSAETNLVLLETVASSSVATWNTFVNVTNEMARGVSNVATFNSANWRIAMFDALANMKAEANTLSVAADSLPLPEFNAVRALAKRMADDVVYIADETDAGLRLNSSQRLGNAGSRVNSVQPTFQQLQQESYILVRKYAQELGIDR